MSDEYASSASDFEAARPVREAAQERHRDRQFAAPNRDRQTRGGNTCVVPGCFRNTREDAGLVSFHSFPKKRHERAIWVRLIQRELSWRPTKNSVVCGRHFVGGRRSNYGSNRHPSIFPERQKRGECSKERRLSVWQQRDEESPVNTMKVDADISESTVVPSSSGKDYFAHWHFFFMLVICS